MARMQPDRSSSAMKLQGKRRGVSQVLAEIVLIAITLIAAVPLTGFVFGEFSTFESPALVAAAVTSCEIDSGTCTVQVSNRGVSNAEIRTTAGCAQLQYSGETVGATGCSAASNTIVGGRSLSVTVTFANPLSPFPVSGQRFVGSILLQNGVFASFAGTFN